MPTSCGWPGKGDIRGMRWDPPCAINILNNIRFDNLRMNRDESQSNVKTIMPTSME